MVLDSYFPPSGSIPDAGLAPFQEFFRVAVDGAHFLSRGIEGPLN